MSYPGIINPDSLNWKKKELQRENKLQLVAMWINYKMRFPPVHPEREDPEKIQGQ